MSFREEFIDKITKRKSIDFEKDAITLFRYQYEHNEVYQKFVDALKVDIESLNSIEQIPFLPIEFFKTHRITSGKFEPEIIYTSSGTTGQQTSKHFVRDNDFYLKSSLTTFQSIYGNIDEYVVLALLPSYLEREGSSLITMAQYFIEKSNDSRSGFFLNEHDQLKKVIQLIGDSKKVLLLGVTFGLLDFAENNSFDFPDQSIIMETGGMKGQRKELLRSEVHEILIHSFKVDSIHSEYGMTELLSQSYSTGNGIFECSDTMRILLRDVTDPLDVSPTLKSGAINVIDLCNIDSCSFIATQDQGKRIDQSKFEIIGRLDNSDIRGCNLMVL